MYYLERACRIQVDALTGGKAHMPTQDAVSMMESSLNKPEIWEGLARQSWPALLRQADRIDPEYKE